MYTIKDIARILDLPFRGLPEAQISTLLTDSRKLTEASNSLFFALDGPRRSGHLFIDELYKSGVRYFVTAQPADKKKYPGAVFLRTENVLEALQQLAAYHRSRFNLEVIGITGSNGKTVVKEWLYQLLHTRYQIVRSPKSYNSQIGVPLSVFQTAARYNLAIFEAGISQPSEMEKLAQIIQPTIGVLTHMGAAHSEGFAHMQAKIQEKLKLFRRARIVIAPGDQEDIRKALSAHPATVCFWGKGPHNTLRVMGVRNSGTGTRIRLSYRDQVFELDIPFSDAASIENAITCCAVMLACGQPIAFIKKGMARLQAVNMRLEFNRAIHNCMVINDSYSADLDAFSIALDFLKQAAKGLPKTVIISDFPDEGGDPKLQYESILDQLRAHGVGRIIGIGPRMQAWLGTIIAEKKLKINYRTYLTTRDFLQQFQAYEFKEEAILIKGARVFEFEQIAALLEQKAHQTVLEINLDAVVHNYKAFQQLLKPATRLMVMVKAFGYGSGGAEIAGMLQYHKADYFGVAYADEGVELRRAGISTPVMVLNPEPAAFESLTEYNLEPAIFSFEQLDVFEQHVQACGIKSYPIHIELETGMNRLGFNPDAVGALGARLRDNEWLRVKSVFSHLAASEDRASDAFTRGQYGLLTEAATSLEQITGYRFIKHIANTAAIIRFLDLQMDMVRVGIGLYGIAPETEAVKLLPALTLKSTIAQLKKLKKGDTVSYNRRGIIERDTLIATVRIGYGDGYSRRLGHQVGYMLVRQQKAPVVGSVCMDMVMIDVTAVRGVKEGDEVIVFGEGLPLEQLARLADTIPYEFMTGISQRVRRVYWSE